METTTLPDAQAITTALTTGIEDDTLRAIYASIAEFENRTFSAGGIVVMLVQAMSDHVAGGERAIMIHGSVPTWIDKLVVNPAVAEEAKEVYAKAMLAQRTSPAEVSLEPPITTLRQAAAYLRHWIEQQGFEGHVRIFQSYGLRVERTGRTYFDFDVLDPGGVFHVHVDGTVEDCVPNVRASGESRHRCAAPRLAA